MTTIAYRDNVLAGDSLVVDDNGLIYPGREIKVRRTKKGVLVGTAGTVSQTQAFFAWIDGDCQTPMPEAGDVEAIIVRPDGGVIHFQYGTRTEVTAPYFAIGTGKEVALGCMFRKGTAVEAIRAAKRHDQSTGGRVVSLRLKRK